MDSPINIYEQTEEQNTKVRESIFSLTINPNITTPNIDSNESQRVHTAVINAMKEIFGTGRQFINEYVTFRKPGHDIKKIVDIDFGNKENKGPTAEFGNQKRWHIQASYIKITHKSNIQLNRSKLVETMAKYANIKPSAVHIEIRVLGYEKKTDEDKMKSYQGKTNPKKINKKNY